MTFYTSVIQRGPKLLVRGIHEGKQFREVVDYKPYHYVPSRLPSDITSIDGKSLSRINFDSIYDAKDYLKKYEDVENFEVYGFKKYPYPYIHDTYKDMEYDFDAISTVYFDIECQSDDGFPRPEDAEKEITAVSFRKGPISIVIGTVDYTPHRKDITYIKCRDEKELLWKFLDVWHRLSPDIISGWNTETFDIPYVVNRMTKVLGETTTKTLSPWNWLREYTVSDKYGAEHQSYEIMGVTTIDMMVAYAKFSYTEHENLRLNTIAQDVLGERKIDYSEHGDNLHRLYLENPQKFIEYNMHDSDLVLRIAEKTGLIRQIVALAYDAGVNFADAFTSVLLWEVIINNYLTDHKMAMPSKHKRNHKDAQIMGAFVKLPQIGKHKWVVGLDLDSLYPHIMMQYNISPETFVECIRSLRDQVTIEDILKGKLNDNPIIQARMKNGKLGYTPNGCFFTNEKRGFLPNLMDTMYADRKRYKKLMIEAKKKNEEAKSADLEALILQYHNLQMAKKICLNSAYGALSNVWFTFFDIDLAEAITYAGQLAIKWIARDLNEYLNKLLKTKDQDYVLASDTDSAYLTLDGLVEKVFPGETDVRKIVNFLVKVCEDKINPLIGRSYEGLKELTNAYEQKMSMKVESVSQSGIWKAKKRYALLMWWDEGVFLKEPKVKIKGIEAVQSSTPKICREAIKDALRIMLDGDKDDLYKLVDDFETKFRSSSFVDIAYSTNVSDMIKYQDDETIYGKKCQAHIRGALLFNHHLKRLNLTKKYQLISSGTKVKVVYLKTPNPINDDVLSVIDALPKEFNLESRIDYDKQFKNEFVNPVNSISKLIGWDIENRATLEAFF